MLVPDDLKYMKTHEWVRVDGNTARIGISDYAQQELNDVVFVDLPEQGRTVAAGDAVCVIESTKAASDVYSPISGKIIAVNEDLNDDPALVNSSPYDQGWLYEVEIQDVSELDGLMTAEQYQNTIQD